MWSHRESNSDLIFRRDLFYPLNYETPQRKVNIKVYIYQSGCEINNFLRHSKISTPFCMVFNPNPISDLEFRNKPMPTVRSLY